MSVTSPSQGILDEETALLPPSTRQSRRQNRTRKPTPLPKLQISILLFLQLAEPITSQGIYPFINELVSGLDITGGDPRAVGYYAGLIASLFFVTEACTVLQWSRLSDVIGRKPVLLIGLSGLCMSMIAFGLSKTFWALVVSRCLAGLLNGNMGVMKSMMGEMTDSTNMAQGFSLIPITWCVGVTIAPFMGGTLARPQDRFPNVFTSPFWREYPYFLPCAAAAAFSALAFLVALVFLKETMAAGHLPEKKLTVETEGNLTLQNTSGCVPYHQGEPCLAPQPPPKPSRDEPVPLRDLMVYPVTISVANYVCLAFLDIAMQALQPLFYSTPIELGGLGLSPPTIGLCLSAFGLMNGTFQAFFFAKIVNHFGPKWLFCVGMTSFLPIFALFPVISLMAKAWGLSPIVWIVLGLQLAIAVVMDMSFGCIFMFITSAAPNRRSLGATNGLAQTTAAVARAVGPAASMSLFAFSVERNLLGGYAVYLFLFIVTLLLLLVAVKLPEDTWDEEKEEVPHSASSSGSESSLEF